MALVWTFECEGHVETTREEVERDEERGDRVVPVASLAPAGP